MPVILSRSGQRQAAIALMIATAMQAFDATIANVALPQLERGLGGGIDLGSWVMTSYLCASAVTATLTGWFRRRWGARPVFTAAIALFVLASSLCALATNPDALILFRLLQGAAAGIILPLSQAIILDIYPKHEHGRMLAIWGATIMAGPMLGPLLGGVITDLASWRWIFAVNAPIGAIALLGLGSVPSRPAPDGGGPIDGRRDCAAGRRGGRRCNWRSSAALAGSGRRRRKPSPKPPPPPPPLARSWRRAAARGFLLFRFDVFREWQFCPRRRLQLYDRRHACSPPSSLSRR